MIIGIDIGGSTTDAVLLNERVEVVSIEANDPVAAAAGALGRLVTNLGHQLSELTAIAATGVGSRSLGADLFGVPVRTVAEMTAIGVGGTTLAGKRDALVVSMGTGTAMVSVKGDHIIHVGGTGVGGGTLLGLSKHLLNVTRIETLEQMAALGDLARVDLTVGDLAGGPVGALPADATASNFGKLSSDASPQDKARALVNMIAEVIVVLSVSTARACDQNDIVLTGKLLRVKPIVERIAATRMLFERQFIIPEHAEFATAIGAARSVAAQIEVVPAAGSERRDAELRRRRALKKESSKTPKR